MLITLSALSSAEYATIMESLKLKSLSKRISKRFPLPLQTVVRFILLALVILGMSLKLGTQYTTLPVLTDFEKTRSTH